MSDTEIANLALGRLAVGQPIGSLSETSQTARVCARFYEQCRREVLRAYPWGFASTAQYIAEVEQTFPGWSYVYQYPNKALMVWSVADESGIRQWCNYSSCRDQYSQLLFADVMRRCPFKIALGTDKTSTVILSDVENAWAYYTYDVTSTALFPPDFTSALAWRLAMEVGGPLRADAGLVSNASNQYFIALSRAAAQTMNEQLDDVLPDSPSIACRS